MPFAYYERLDPDDQAIYRQSDAATSIRLPGASELWPVIDELRRALERDDAAAVAVAAARLCGEAARSLGAPAPIVHVLAVRPREDWGELHGLYTMEEGGPAHVRVWMRTARKARVVAFRTFLRTLLHELVHHLDFTVLGLPRSFHTEGFFKRESSLFHQLVPGGREPPRPRGRGR